MPLLKAFIYFATSQLTLGPGMTIKVSFDAHAAAGSLPTVAACFGRLRFPQDFRDAEDFYQRLRTAITDGASGFHRY